MTLALLLSLFADKLWILAYQNMHVWRPKFCIFIRCQALLFSSITYILFLCPLVSQDFCPYYFNTLMLFSSLKMTENWTGVEVVKLLVQCSSKDKTSFVFAGEPDCPIDRTWALHTDEKWRQEHSDLLKVMEETWKVETYVSSTPPQEAESCGF